MIGWPLTVSAPKWSNTLEQFVSNLPMNCLSVFDHFVWLLLKGLKWKVLIWPLYNFNSIENVPLKKPKIIVFREATSQIKHFLECFLNCVSKTVTLMSKFWWGMSNLLLRIVDQWLMAIHFKLEDCWFQFPLSACLDLEIQPHFEALRGN